MKPIKQAVILAGGLGIRMRPLTLSVPKPMISIHGKPFLEYLIELLKENGIKEVILLVGFLHEKIERYFEDGKKYGISIKYSFSPVEADTGTRIKNSLILLEKNFLLLYGDNYWPLKLKDLIKFYNKKKLKAVVTVYSNLYNLTKNNMHINEKGVITVYDRSRKKKNLNSVDIGFFILNKDIFTNLPKNNFSFENVILKKLVKDGQLAGFLTHHKYYSLSTPDRLDKINKYFQPKKILFLDRDGVINKKPSAGEYVTSWEEFIFLPKVKEGLKILQDKGYLLYMISNQAGIARKVVTKEKVDQINNKLKKNLKNIGIKISGIYICPHGWDDKCFCRKPNPGLFFKCAEKEGINLFESYYIGDDLRDIMAGKMAGTKTVYIQNEKDNFSEIKKIKPDLIAENLYDAALKI